MAQCLRMGIGHENVANIVRERGSSSSSTTSIVTEVEGQHNLVCSEYQNARAAPSRTNGFAYDIFYYLGSCSSVHSIPVSSKSPFVEPFRWPLTVPVVAVVGYRANVSSSGGFAFTW